jgi:hypothetical protein
MQCFRVDVAPTRPLTTPWRLPRFPSGAECKSVMVAERINRHYDGKPPAAQVGIMYKVAGLLLVFVLPLYPCALRAQTTNASITGRETDPSKATIADAKVSTVNLRTNFRYETATMARANTAVEPAPLLRTASKWKRRDSRSSFGRT